MKKDIFLFALLLLCNCIQAQSSDSIIIQQIDSLIDLSKDLREKGSFSEAFPIAESAKKLALNQLGNEHLSYANCLDNLGILNTISGQYPTAESLFVEAKIIRENLFGIKHFKYSKSLNNLGNLYAEMGKFARADSLYLQELAILRSELDKEDPILASSLNNIGGLYVEMGRFKEAEPLHIEAKNIREKALGKEHPDYSQSLNNLGILYYHLGYYKQAESLYIEAKNIREKVSGKEHRDYAGTLNNLAGLYMAIGYFETAEPLLIESKNIREKLFGKEHPDYAVSLNNLAYLHLNLGHFEKAKTFIMEANDIWKKVFGNEHPSYATNLSNLGDTHAFRGGYEEAEQILTEAKRIREKQLGKEHPDYAVSLYSLASLYYEMGRRKEADLMHREAQNIWKKALGANHPNYAQSLNNLGNSYADLGDYETAEQLLTQAKVIREKILGKKNPAYTQSLNNLAALYVNTERYEEAETLHLEALNIRKETPGKNHPSYINSLNNLAALYAEMGKYTEAEKMFSEAISIQNKINHTQNRLRIATLTNFSELYENIGKWEEAIPLILEADTIQQAILSKGTNHLSEMEMEDYIRLFSNESASRFAFALRHPDTIMNKICYDNLLFYKGFLLENAEIFRKRLLQIEDDSTRFLANRWKGTQRRLSKEYDKPQGQRQDLTSLEAEANRLEKELIRRIPALKDAKRNIRWQQVQDGLQADEVAIEFTHFRYQNPELTDSILYCAFVLRKEYEYPRLVYLFEEAKLQEQMRQDTTDTEDYIEFVYRGTGKVHHAKLSKLHQLIWQPIDSLLLGVRKVYYSPSGLLHRISIAAISINRDSCLLDKYNLYYVGSTRELAIRKETKPDISIGLIYGGIEYDQDSLAIKDCWLEKSASPKSPDAFYQSLFSGYRGENSQQGFQTLPGTKREIQRIARLFEQQQRKITQLTEHCALEETVKALGEKVDPPDVLHFATHGFFFNVPIKNKKPNDLTFKYSENPLLRSGLILAGANAVWTGGSSLSGFDDGILTAYEIANLDLSGTYLAVLSACETGLGEIHDSEGVYGMQRAFRIAGVEHLIMSLWKVADSATVKFMDVFYRHLLTGKEIRAAFLAAQKEIREQHEEPYYWAGFVLI